MAGLVARSIRNRLADAKWKRLAQLSGLLRFAEFSTNVRSDDGAGPQYPDDCDRRTGADSGEDADSVERDVAARTLPPVAIFVAAISISGQSARVSPARRHERDVDAELPIPLCRRNCVGCLR